MAKNKPDTTPKTVLLTRFSALGDVAISLPQIYDACVANPDTRFVMLTRKHAAAMFVNPPKNLVVEGVDLNKFKGVTGLYRLFTDIYNRYRPDAFADLHDVVRTKVLTLFGRLKGMKVSVIRKDRAAKKALTRTRNKVLIPLIPTWQRYRDTLHRIGVEYNPSFTTLFPDGASTDLFATASAPKKEGEFWLAVAPFAMHPGKIYPMDLMEQVVANFSARPRTRIFVMGFGPTEMEIIDSWKRRYPGIVNMAALNLGLKAELALLAHCDTMLSMDSANMHLASLVGLRSVSIWGATHPFCGFMGYNQKEEDALQLNMTCRPCSVFGNKPCRRGDYHCLHGISPQRIIDRILKDGK